MKKIILIGRSEAGKTSLSQAMLGEAIHYDKTQAIRHLQEFIDTPGEYAQCGSFGRALALYTYEADVVGLLLSATEPYSLYPPCVVSQCNRPVIGIITKMDAPGANPQRAKNWLSLAGCKTIFATSAVTGKGVPELLEYLEQ